MNRKTLIVITGATASGKTALAVDVAERLGCDIISADSRQIYRDLPIGTAAPTPDDLRRVRHHLVGTMPLEADYSAARFEADVTALLPRLWQAADYAVMCGGSMMYVDAVTDGIDPLPDISPLLRQRVKDVIEQQGLEAALAWLEIVDPDYAATVDRNNPRRVAHALEISLQSGRPYSSMRTGRSAARDFNIVKLAIDMPRPQLFERIAMRVDRMIEAGLVDEARAVEQYRSCNALNTVGYKEIYQYLDGECTLDEAAARIARNTRVYAKKQLTWLRRPGIRPAVWLPPTATASDVISLL